MNDNIEKMSEENEIITTESAKFDDIRHYKDDEVPSAIQSILNDDVLISGISKYMFKKLPKFMVTALKPLLKFVLKRKCAKGNTIKQVQEFVATFMRGIIRDKSDGISFTG